LHGSALDDVLMSRSRFLGFLAVLTVAGGVVGSFGACSSSPAAAAAQCNSNPFQCGSGTTCAVSKCTCTDENCSYKNCTPEFACLPSFSSGLAGEACTNMVGSASCDDGLTCVQEKNVQMGDGVCTAYCNSSNPCATQYVCVAIGVELGPSASAPIIHVCQAEPSDGDIIVVDEGGPEGEDAGDSGTGGPESGLSDRFHAPETSPH
jgi:hypothetical protein